MSFTHLVLRFSKSTFPLREKHCSEHHVNIVITLYSLDLQPMPDLKRRPNLHLTPGRYWRKFELIAVALLQNLYVNMRPQSLLNPQLTVNSRRGLDHPTKCCVVTQNVNFCFDLPHLFSPLEKAI